MKQKQTNPMTQAGQIKMNRTPDPAQTNRQTLNRESPDRRKLFRLLSCLVLLAVFAGMLLFNLWTPMVSDDYAHYFGMEGVHVTSLSDIAHNMALFRETTNGRVISHFLVYLFLALPKVLFCVLNAAVSTLILVLLARYTCTGPATGAGGKPFCLLLLSILFLWGFTPAFGEIYLWLTGAINYSWGLALDLLYLYPFACAFLFRPCAVVDEKGVTLRRVLYALLGFLVGAYSENGGMAMLFLTGILGLLLGLREKKLPVYLFCVYLCSLAGFAFLMLAPATFATRVGESGDLREHIWYCRVLMKQYLTLPMIIYLVLFALAFFLHRDRRLLFFTLLLIVTAYVSVAVFIFAAYLPSRSFMIAVSLISLAILLLLSELWETKVQKAVLASAVLSVPLFLWLLIPGARDILQLHTQQQERDAIFAEAISNAEADSEINEEADGETDGETDSETNGDTDRETSGISAGETARDINVTIPALQSQTNYSAAGAEDLSEDSSYWYNDLIARYYGVATVTRRSSEPESVAASDLATDTESAPDTDPASDSASAQGAESVPTNSTTVNDSISDTGLTEGGVTQ